VRRGIKLSNLAEKNIPVLDVCTNCQAEKNNKSRFFGRKLAGLDPAISAST
jgi:hypothetical protein